ncbi:DUF533 domain-containing protein [Allorhodopirellula solitaria]|uniref:Inner membrane protein YebE n=1 Tax=Allorhodopirellula solitaria TaxID=2527987 RepID=A0A5C5XU20_9BACT|nr:DUF533 domain-containing protein [Allorhodopirellula solitaria]TWT66400.1 Inner membrane protein YebE [Allorhodopirellula solitaria]
MDITDILGSLLGSQTRRGGSGRGGAAKSAPQRSSPSRAPSSGSSGPIDIDREAKELEDILHVAKDRHAQGPDSTARPSPSAPAPSARQTGVDPEQGTLLVRAMINAAKADGSLDQTEQQKIIKQLKNPTRESLKFLQDEFDRPMDVRGFAMSVPVGMEQQVYTMSLMTIQLDTGDEAKYLKELGDTLRLSQDVREQIHERMGAPSVY